MIKNHIVTVPLLILIILTFTIKKVIAQIIPDQSLPQNSQVISGCNICEINGGTIRNTNLFHSFEKFSIPQDGEAYFNNNANINNIFVRVTGNSISYINGMIRNNDHANLFLINPHGIIFGEKASLNLGGSFIASTAKSIKFADNSEFNSQINSEINSTSPLLTITAPIGLQMSVNSGIIQLENTTALQIKPNQTLGLIANNLNLQKSTLVTNGGRLELGSVNQESLVKINSIPQGFTLDYQDIQKFGNIQLSQGSTINTSGIIAGEININTGNLSIIEDSRIASFNLGSIPGGKISINASDTVEVIGNGDFEMAFGQVINPFANATNNTNGFFAVNLGTGNGSNFQMNTDKLSLKNGAFLLISTFGAGDSGNININARKTIEVSDSLLATGNRFLSTGNAGNISLNTQDLIINNRGLVTTSSLGTGNAGNINIQATNSIKMTGGATFEKVIVGGGINTNITSSTFGSGNSGNIDISTQNLKLENQAEILVNTFGSGNGGNLTINATNIELFGATQKSSKTLVTALGGSSGVNGTGNGGNLTINTHNLLVRDGSQISTDTIGIGKAGNMMINAENIQLIDSINSLVPNGLFASSSGVNIGGDGGNITINTNNLLVQDGAQINTDTNSNGQAGNININARNIQVIGMGKSGNSSGNSSVLFAGSSATATGKAGDILVNTNNLEIKDQGRISVEVSGQGNAGNININASSILLDNLAIISANTRSENNNLQEEQASINLTAESLIMRHGSKITTNAMGNNVNGGNIYINTGVLVALENSDISANSTDFRGGKVTVNAQGIFGTKFRSQLTNESDITATGVISELNGTVKLNITDFDVTRSLATLSDDLVNTELLLSNNICNDDRIVSSSFMITGKGGLPANSEDLITNSPGLVEWVNKSSLAHKTPVILHPKTELNQKNRVIQQAQGWIISNNGRIILTAEVPTLILQDTGLNHPHCFSNKIPNFFFDTANK